MDVIDSYEEELKDLFSQIDKKMAAVKSGGDAPEALINAEVLLDQVADLLKQMSVEVRSLEGNERQEKNAMMAGYKTRHEETKIQVKTAKTAANKRALLGDADGKSLEHRERMVDTNDKLARQNEMILNAQRIVAETEDVGADITSTLGDNRAKIESSRDKVKELHGDLDAADRITKSMVDRAKCVIS